MTFHRCPIHTCTEEVRHEHLMCWQHWQRVPRNIRGLIWRTRGLRDKSEYFQYVRQAIDVVEKKLGLEEEVIDG